MDILEQLKREQAQRAAPADRSEGAEVPEALQRAMERLYAGLERLAEGLTDLDPDVRVRYDAAPAGTLASLRQGEYAVRTEDPALPRFAFTFRCSGRHPLHHAAKTVEEKDQTRLQFEAYGLDFTINDMSTWQYVFTVQPTVRVRLVFEPMPDGSAIRMSAHNLTRLGVELYSIDPQSVRRELLNELGKLVLRRANRFAELSGNRVSDQIRKQLQARVSSRAQSREQLKREMLAEEEGKPAPRKRLLGGRAQAAAAKRANAPAGGGGPQPDAGSIDWKPPDLDGAADNSVASDRASDFDPMPLAIDAKPRGEPPPVQYAWFVTADALSADTAASLGRRGPPGSSGKIATAKILTEGEEFRLRGRDGRIQFTGMIAGEYQGVEPLVDFGLDHECAAIEYRRDGKWIRVRPTD